MLKIVIARVDGLKTRKTPFEGVGCPLENTGNEVFVTLREHAQIRRLYFLSDYGRVLCRDMLIHCLIPACQCGRE